MGVYLVGVSSYIRSPFQMETSAIFFFAIQCVIPLPVRFLSQRLVLIRRELGLCVWHDMEGVRVIERKPRKAKEEAEAKAASLAKRS